MEPSSDRNQPRPVSAIERSSRMQLALRWIRHKVVGRPENSLKEMLGEVLEEDATDGLAISEEEKSLLKNMIHFGELTVRDIMVPRTDIMGVDVHVSMDELKKHVVEIGHTRIPVYNDTLDKIEGFLHVKDLFSHLFSGQSFQITEVMRELLFVPPSMRIVDLLMKMRVSGCHMAVVVDEYGGTDGLITMEDLFEELVGEIQDEHDHEDEAPMMVWHGDFVLEADARTSIFDLESELGQRITSGDIHALDYDTVGGLVFAALGRVPVKGEVLHVSGHIKIEIIAADPRRIHRVRVVKQA